jgi:hypothetical protein
MLNEHNGDISGGRESFEQLGECLQAACRSTHTHNGRRMAIRRFGRLDPR